MEQFVLDLVDWIRAQPLMGIYAILLLIAYLENVIPPIPGDVLVVFGGYLVAENILAFSWVLVATTIGSVLGFMTMYYFGYLVGDGIRTRQKRFWFLKYFDGEYMHRAERWMFRWGQGVVLANRFLAGARSIISIMAGVTRLNLRKTVIYATLGAAAWNIVLIGAGWFIGDNWPLIQDYLNLYGSVILAAIIIYIVYRLGIYYLNRRRSEGGSEGKNNLTKG
jgi:membrane protein DedA with SNARE-associated domain